MGLALDRAVVVALFVETIIYGICLTLSVITTVVFVRVRAKGGLADKRLLVALLLMVLTATTNIVIAFVRVFIAFCVNPSTPDGPDRYFADITQPLFIAKNAGLLVQTLWGDLVNMWRCSVVYNKSKMVIIPPAVMSVAGIVTGSLILVTSARASEGTTVFANPSRWIKSYDVLMMSTNLYCTGSVHFPSHNRRIESDYLTPAAILWRIYRSGSRNTFTSSLFPVLLAILETGALYTACLTAFLIAYWSGSNGQYIIIAIIPPLVPCLFCLLVLQVKYHKSGSNVYGTGSLPRSADRARVTTDSSPFSGMRRTLQFGKERSKSPFPKFSLTPIQIATETEVHFSHGEASDHKKGSSVPEEDSDD
ncbi:hypothetical protein EVG20_g10717 [Dentipellis fragilis]|uniref:Uncharacterized protein n=1 Tax=Dentipellis fragilis TaxID=205917 RepID=A0A4Y9XPP6_9AGAM|nr:hypothetical protein EVG20_g10717 [Dentipellis fragilis]